VQVDVTLDDQGNLEEQDVTEVGNAQDTMDLEGQVLSVDTAANTISVSADDCDKSGAALVVHVPDASKFQVGDEVEMTVTGPAADGSFTLVQSSGDDNSDEADDNSGDQGDGGGDSQGDGGDNQGDGSGD
jgi:hypothetical protein